MLKKFPHCLKRDYQTPAATPLLYFKQVRRQDISFKRYIQPPMCVDGLGMDVKT